MVEIDPAQLGTLDLDEMWVPYVDMHDADFVPARVKIVNDEYAYKQTFPIFGHGAVMPQAIRQFRADGKKPIVIERDDRYYVYVTPP
jgi:hypothetical protein